MEISGSIRTGPRAQRPLAAPHPPRVPSNCSVLQGPNGQSSVLLSRLLYSYREIFLLLVALDRHCSNIQNFRFFWMPTCPSPPSPPSSLDIVFLVQPVGQANTQVDGATPTSSSLNLHLHIIATDSALVASTSGSGIPSGPMLSHCLRMISPRIVIMSHDKNRPPLIITTIEDRWTCS